MTFTKNTNFLQVNESHRDKHPEKNQILIIKKIISTTNDGIEPVNVVVTGTYTQQNQNDNQIHTYKKKIKCL